MVTLSKSLIDLRVSTLNLNGVFDIITRIEIILRDTFLQSTGKTKHGGLLVRPKIRLF